MRADVTPLGATGKVFDGGVSLGHPEVFAFLPFQVNEGRHVVALYVATYDALKPMPEERYRLVVRGLAAPPRSARLLDPLTGRSTEMGVVVRDGGAVQVDVPVMDYPRLLILD